MPLDAFIVSTKTDAELLRAAKACIDKPTKWCQNKFNNAMRLCTLSALNHALGSGPGPGIRSDLEPTRTRLAKRLIKVEPDGFTVDPDDDAESAVCILNNTVSHRELMQVFDKAIAMAEGDV